MEPLLPVVTWVVWVLVVACIAAAALAVAAAVVGCGVLVPVGIILRVGKGAWPRWFRPTLSYSGWALAFAALFGGFAFLFLN